MRKASRTIHMFEAIAPNLMLRGVADAFFDRLEKMDEENLMLDFTGVESISRSFAHQYMIRKKVSTKAITEVHMPSDVTRMLELVERSSSNRPRIMLPKISQRKVVTI